MDELEQIKKDIKEIKERNARVEADKAFETSLARKILICDVERERWKSNLFYCFSISEPRSLYSPIPCGLFRRYSASKASSYITLGSLPQGTILSF